MAEIHLTHRALEDLQTIYDYSIKEWGEKVADGYLNDIQEFLVLLESSPKMLRTDPRISSRFKVQQIRRHWLVCDVIDENIYVLTVKHMSMDVMERLKDLEPTLENESTTFFKELKKRKSLH